MTRGGLGERLRVRDAALSALGESALAAVRGASSARRNTRLGGMKHPGSSIGRSGKPLTAKGWWGRMRSLSGFVRPTGALGTSITH